MWFNFVFYIVSDKKMKVKVLYNVSVQSTIHTIERLILKNSAQNGKLNGLQNLSKMEVEQMRSNFNPN
jgi:hypothetical protein